jgi:hypothetical protein
VMYIEVLHLARVHNLINHSLVLHLVKTVAY